MLAALCRWGVALLEYLLQVPGKRIWHQVRALGPKPCSLDRKPCSRGLAAESRAKSGLE
ncbi:MAG: hypothetical protein ACK6DB_00045 [Planctomycetota bacterium]